MGKKCVKEGEGGGCVGNAQSLFISNFSSGAGLKKPLRSNRRRGVTIITPFGGERG